MCILDELRNAMSYISGSGRIVARDREHLKELIRRRIKKYGPNCNLNDIDVSNVTRMNSLFKNSKFNGDISKWDVSNVTDMSEMFRDSDFNGDISDWDVSSVKDMKYMFASTIFTNDISK